MVNTDTDIQQTKTVVVMAGTNNIDTNRLTPVELVKYLRPLKEMRNCKPDLRIIVIGIPLRHDKPYLTQVVHNINSYLNNWCAKNYCVFIEIQNYLERTSYTTHEL